MQKAEAASKSKAAILIAEGIYTEGTISLKENVDLFGGFNEKTWKREIQQYETILNGENKTQLLIAANNVRIDGFVLTNGSVRGNGGAILCKGVSPIITNNVFLNNKTLKPSDWNPKYMHLTANDSGALYGENAAPNISHNLFINNETENGRGGAIAFNNHCRPVIESNVFINNKAGLDDPMRSSDGGAVSVFNWCNAIISGNLFLSNKALAKNDVGAVFVALWSSAKITGNLMVDSESGDDAGALFVGGQEHRYDGPLDALPPKEKFYVSIDHNGFFGNKNPTVNSGAMRLTMETRGEFTNNVSAFNTGIYFQRSEVSVKNNLLLDNFLFVETKEGLGQSVIERNVIGGDFRLEAPATVKGNWLKEACADNNTGLPSVKNDGASLTVLSAIYDKHHHSTDLLIASPFSVIKLMNRVVRSGGKWGIVGEANANRMTVWGDLSGADAITLLPTYTIAKK